MHLAIMKRCAMFLLAIFGFTAFSLAQTVTGTVTDKKGEPLPGVTVSVKGTKNATSTSTSGVYTLNNVGSDAVLVFTGAGITTRELSVSGRSSVSTEMETNVSNLNEVVVVGYGTRKLKDLTGSVASLSDKDFNKGVIASPEQMIQGRTSGVTITPASGEPGAGVSINIRGTASIRSGNNPLFVVDGVPLDGGGTSGGLDVGFGTSSARNPLSFINPADIENITILKDASAAAIYGARGANGVVLITTKTGRGKPSLQFSASTSVSKIAKRYDLLNAEDFAVGVTQAGGNGSDPTINKGASTDWQDQIFRTGVSQNYNLSYGGSHANTNYRVSLGYFDQAGIIKNSGLKRLTGRLNVTQKLLNDKLKIDLTYTGSQVKNTYAPISDNAGFQGSLIGAALIANPTYPISENGSYTLAGGGSSSLNPVAMLDYISDNDKIFRNLGNISGSYTILKGLVYKATFGYDHSSADRGTYFDPRLKGLTGTQNIRNKEIASVSSDNNGNGRGIVQKNQLTTLLVEHTVTYDLDVTKNQQLNLVGGFSYQKTKINQQNNVRWGAQTPGEPTKDITSFKNGLPYEFGDTTQTELQSYFGRANYTINDKYYLTATVRIDGSSKFGSGNKYGTFPAFAAKWKLSNEGFFGKGRNFFDELSVRGNWGITGNQEFPAYASLFLGRVNLDGSKSRLQDGNPDLKWEQTTTTGAGIDYSILKGRIRGNIDYYRRDTKDLLFFADAPQPSSNPQKFINLPGIVRNTGLEFGFNVQAINSNRGAFKWDISYNMTFMKNVVKDFGQNEVPTGNINGQGLTGAYAQVIKNNYPLFTYKMPLFLGFDATGRNNFGYLGQDRLLGSALPTFTAGFTNNFSIKKWTVSFFVNAVTGFYVYNNTANALFLKGSLKTGHNVSQEVVNSPEDGFNTGAVSSRFLEKGDFLRLSNASVGYTFALKPASAIKSLNVNFSGQNLLLITGYSGIDPEVNTNKEKDGVPSRGIDYTAYPSARTFTLSLSARF
jgi:TonB-linked SusC/RagA family outer membrane protein